MPGHVLGLLDMVVSKRQSLPFLFSVEGKETDNKQINAYINVHLKKKMQDRRKP